MLCAAAATNSRARPMSFATLPSLPLQELTAPWWVCSIGILTDCIPARPLRLPPHSILGISVWCARLDFSHRAPLWNRWQRDARQRTHFWSFFSSFLEEKGVHPSARGALGMMMHHNWALSSKLGIARALRRAWRINNRDWPWHVGTLRAHRGGKLDGAWGGGAGRGEGEATGSRPPPRAYTRSPINT